MKPRWWEAGQAMALSGLLMPLLAGFAGLTLDIGNLALHHRRAQSTADAAALAAAFQLYQGGTEAAATASADQVVQQNGYTTANYSLAFLDTNGAPTTVAANVVRVRAVVSETVRTMFISVLGLFSQSLAETASATVWHPDPYPPCVLCLLSKNAVNALYLLSNQNVNVVNGSVVVNSNSSSAINLPASGSLTVHPAPQFGISMVGGVRTSSTGQVTPTPTKIASPIPDPLSMVPVPSAAGLPNYGNYSSQSSHGNETINPGVYGDISLDSSGTLTFNPGLYIITGSVRTNAPGNVVANGVTLYLTCGTSSNPVACAPGQAGGSIDLNSNGNFTISPPTSGTYKGLSVFFDRNNTAGYHITSNGNSASGTIYGASASMVLESSGAVVNSNSMLVMNTIALNDSTGGISIIYDGNRNYTPPGGWGTRNPPQLI